MKNTFEFMTCNHLIKLLNISARNIEELLEHLLKVPDSSIYMHTFKFIRSHHYLENEPSNDFAYWVMNILKNEELGEILSNVDPFQFNSISGLRRHFHLLIRDFISKNHHRTTDVPEGQEFQFMSCLSLVKHTGIYAANLQDFLNGIKKVSLNSVYFHMFEARLRLKRQDNDFSIWLRDINEHSLADRIASMNIYYFSLAEIKRRIVEIIDKSIEAR